MGKQQIGSDTLCECRSVTRPFPSASREIDRHENSSQRNFFGIGLGRCARAFRNDENGAIRVADHFLRCTA